MNPVACHVCRRPVPRDEAQVSGGAGTGQPWRFRCRDCPADAPAAPVRPAVTAALDAPPPLPTRLATVRLELDRRDPTRAVARLEGRASDGAFAGFVDLLHGVGGTELGGRGSRVFALAVGAVPRLVRRLRDEAMLDVEADPALAAHLQTAAVAARREIDRAEGRIAAMRGHLAERGLRLLPYQEVGVAWLAERLEAAGGAALLADAPGVGKTIQTLVAAPEAAYVVVVPASVAGNWEREFSIWRPDVRVTRCRGLDAIHRWPERGEACVLSYAGLPWTPEERERRSVCPTCGGNGTDPDCPRCDGTGRTGAAALFGPAAVGIYSQPPPAPLVLVADECHRLKATRNLTRRRWDALRAAAGPDARALGLTGTPLVNEPGEVFSILVALGLADAFGTRARMKRMNEHDPEGYTERLRRVMLRRLKRDVLTELPPVTFTDVPVEIDGATRQKLDDLLLDLVSTVAGKAAEKAHRDALDGGASAEEADRLAEFRRETVASDVEAAIDMVFAGEVVPPFELMARCKAILAAATLPAAREILDDEPPAQDADGAWDDPWIFASAHLPAVDDVAARSGWARIDGSVDQDVRTEVVAAFQRGAHPGIALSIRAGGEGITLTRSSRILQNDQEWTPSANQQLVGRVERIGQTRPVTVIRLVAEHPLARRIVAVNDRKARDAEAFVDVAAVAAAEAAVGGPAPVEPLEGVRVVAGRAGAVAATRPARRDVEVWAANAAARRGERPALEASEAGWARLVRAAHEDEAAGAAPDENGPRRAGTADEATALRALEAATPPAARMLVPRFVHEAGVRGLTAWQWALVVRLARKANR